MRIYLFILLVAAAVTYLITPAVRLLARRAGAMTAVRERDVHDAVTPRLGGLAMLAGVVVAMLIASNVPFLEGLFRDTRQPWAILVAAALVCLLGAADDKWDLDWWAKLAGQVLAAMLLAWQGVSLVSLPIGGVTILSERSALILTVLVVVVSMNAVNFVDGLDGLAAGVMAIGGSAFFLYAYMLTRTVSTTDYSSLAALLTAVLIGACVGFLPHNMTRARIFMGDSGSMLLGLLLAASTIAVTGQVDPARLSGADIFGQFLPILLPIGVMVIPFLDFALAVVRRIGSGKSPFHADKAHLHHRLLRLGHSKRTAVLIMYTWTVVVSVGLLLPIMVSTRAVVIFWVCGLLFALLLTFDPLRWRPGRHRKDSDVPST
ncbi:undecaprenyl-phosphate alpha-N-acetylglucosaminyl 1-phosphate transferase [Brachybacterium sp. P6-10-X1]|uniref:glycosyltransferase family 4 protein n=1 Tax=Brachybacterium sp. P6-10-X1 TaxID=1903186 RepID=UPI00097181B2|nr:MraY family glycosyltransferase [Brachybacterium sp. P6-10-X1]APX32287.1 undecaprenyl-phosphate alpha-N-acetylglucosaminyl 1-phosphate transferase [Brachybacterium sp. P6-10-X1]